MNINARIEVPMGHQVLQSKIFWIMAFEVSSLKYVMSVHLDCLYTDLQSFQ